MPTNSPTKPDLGPINPETIYPLQVFCALTGLEKAALRKMRANGFQVRRIGKRSYIIGRDFLNYVSQYGDDVA